MRGQGTTGPGVMWGQQPYGIRGSAERGAMLILEGRGAPATRGQVGGMERGTL